MLAHCGGRTMPAVFLLLSKKWGVDGRSPPWIRGELLLKKALSFAESAKMFVGRGRVCGVCGGGKFPKIYGANIPQIYSFCAKELAKTILPRIFAAKL